MSKLKNEPAVVTSVLVALVGAAATLGIIGTDTQDQLVAVITAVVPIIGGLIVRANVTPTRKLAVATDLEPPVQEDLAAEVPDPAPTPAPAPSSGDDPVKASMKAAIEIVRAQSNAQNDARAAAATAAVDAQP